MAVILDLPFNICIWISAAVVIVYTLMGGLYCVAYTDVVQFVLIVIGLVSSHKTHSRTFTQMDEKEVCWTQRILKRTPLAPVMANLVGWVQQKVPWSEFQPQ